VWKKRKKGFGVFAQLRGQRGENIKSIDRKERPASPLLERGRRRDVSSLGNKKRERGFSAVPGKGKETS